MLKINHPRNAAFSIVLPRRHHNPGIGEWDTDSLSHSRLQRDEAIRSGALAAMSLMYAAKARGYDTGPMIGFDPEAVSDLLDIPADHIPVMMVVLGKCLGKQPARRGRHPVREVVRLESMRGKGLA